MSFILLYNIFLILKKNLLSQYKFRLGALKDKHFIIRYGISTFFPVNTFLQSMFLAHSAMQWLKGDSIKVT